MRPEQTGTTVGRATELATDQLPAHAVRLQAWCNDRRTSCTEHKCSYRTAIVSIMARDTVAWTALCSMSHIGSLRRLLGGGIQQVASRCECDRLLRTDRRTRFADGRLLLLRGHPCAADVWLPMPCACCHIAWHGAHGSHSHRLRRCRQPEKPHKNGRLTRQLGSLPVRSLGLGHAGSQQAWRRRSSRHSLTISVRVSSTRFFAGDDQCAHMTSR